MRSWLWHHYDCAVSAAVRLARTPLSTLVNFVVIGMAVALPAGLFVVLAALQSSASALAPAPQLSLFLSVDAGARENRDIAARLKRHAAVGTYRFVPRDEALAELKAATGLADVIDSLPHNPLPDAFVVEPRAGAPDALDALRRELAGWPGIAHVQVDSAWAQRLAVGLRVGRIVAGILASLFAFALVVVTVNTVRLQMLTRRDEIEVMRLIGATDAFIRRPFLYFGALQGLCGGVAGCVVVWLVIQAVSGPLAELAALYGSRFQFGHLDARGAAAAIGVSAGLGWLGSWLSVAWHLASREGSTTAG